MFNIKYILAFHSLIHLWGFPTPWLCLILQKQLIYFRLPLFSDLMIKQHFNVNMYVCIHTCVHVQIFMSILLHAGINVCMYLDIYVHIYLPISEHTTTNIITIYKLR